MGSGATSQLNPKAEADLEKRNAGNINISTGGNLTLKDGGRVDVSTNDLGDAGNIDITATGNVTFEGENLDGFGSGATSQVNPEAKGNAGNITVSIGGSLNLSDRGRVDASSFGEGNAGLVNIEVTGGLFIDGEKNLQGFGSGVASLVAEGVKGNSACITISTGGNLTLTNEGRVDTTNGGMGNAGNISVSTGGKLALTNGGQINANTNQGNGGQIDIIAASDITFEGKDSQGFGSGITSLVDLDTEGDSGNVTIFTGGNLSLKDGGRVDVGTSGKGNAGLIDITATGDITFKGRNSANGFGSGVTSQVNPGATGNSAGIIISTQGNLSLKDGGRVDASANNSQGNAGNVVIDANSIELANEATIIAQTQSETVNSANIELKVAEDITLDNNSLISAEALNNANGGNLTIDSNFIIAFPNGNNDIIASAEQGQGGNIEITGNSYLIGIKERPLNNSTNDINASSDFGIDGRITIDTIGLEAFQETAEPPANIVESDQVVTRVCDPTKAAENILAGEENTLTIQERSTSSSHQIDLMTSNQILDRTSSPSGYKKSRKRKKAAPILTAQGAIYPARGVVRQADGTIILTAHNLDRNQRAPVYSPNCG
ncbi:MAG: hypothetical protein QNJ72_35835 [Pleurocapsa sp. MO_226.B13]|nr:hypothetical protein [Pleurocapsa sp. MO_226.B13]